MSETKKQREEREAAEAAAAAQSTEPTPVEPLELSQEGFDVTQPPPESDRKVDYSKTTMPVLNDPATPADFDPDSNRKG